ncbi:Methyl-accepting chemotaxis protein [Saccharicrinis carchari]|uniref:Methyl-accepting chemotaxis protein n=1 Tax=Saccharicrinis carchari TaxID=1168039 RepID=A0A521CF06_SACCC|nr:methyl-accepting chemotaxis protein [Saccharicrinis carchari]SMO58014.1 Methyl-accepting chemotaxis protein [Saccharicrinis carchari]
MKLKLNIAQKLMAGIGIILVAIMINGVATYITLNNSRSLSDEITQVYSPSQQNIQLFKDMIINSRALIKSWVFIDRQPGTADKLTLENLHANDYPSVIKELDANKTNWDKADQATFDAIKLKTDSLFQRHQYVMSSLNTFEAYDDVMIIFDVEPMVGEDGEIMEKSNAIIKELEILEHKFGNLNTAALKEMDESFRWFGGFVIFMIVLLVSIASAIAYWLYNSIIKPLNKAVVFTQAIGKGNLMAQLDVDQDDEIGKMAEALKAMASNIKNIVISIKENANDLVSSGQNVKNSSVQLSKGSADQAASAEEVSTSIEEMVANIDQNTDNAVQTEKITVETAKDVKVADKLSTEAAEAMKSVAGKITIIGDIAFQTNILALNAAVEAARAGEHGRGFSVVAAEVRKLAERSKLAADEIHNLVNGGLKVSQESGEKARLLVPDIETTTQLIKEISAASLEQKTGAEQINMAMQQLNLITQENASSSDELTQSAEQLAVLADKLKKAVSFFMIGEMEEIHSVAKENTANDNRIKQTERAKESTPQKAKDNQPKGNLIDLEMEMDMDNYEKY